MPDKKEVPAPENSVGAENEQTQTINTGIIASEAAGVNDEIGPSQRKISLKTFTLDEALDSYFEPKEPIIENLLNQGTYILAGASKIGKSFLVAEIAFHVATGKDLWSENYRTNRGRVLYLALEDDIRRIQDRFSRMFGTEGSDNLSFATASKTMDEGLILQLAEYLKVFPDTKLIIIDTLQKIRGLSNENISYSRDYDVITQLKNLSDTNNLCILIVHHTRKQEADDCFEKISGTNGLMGSADGAIIMTRPRGGIEAKLQITGRDQQEQIINMEQDQETLQWKFKDAETSIWKEPPDPVIDAICNMVEEKRQWFGSASDLINEMNLAGIAPNALTRKLNSKSSMMWNDRRIRYISKRSGSLRGIYLEAEKK